jgi:long-chain acyl-CoA synthetase
MDQGTIPQLFVAKARQYGSGKVALREKAYGIWQEVTWQQYYDHVYALCLGLTQVGLQPGDKLAITGVALSRAGSAVCRRHPCRTLRR